MSADIVDAWIVRLSSLGDIVHALPLVTPLRRAGVNVGWVAEDRFAAIFDYVSIDGAPVPLMPWDRRLRSRRQLRVRARGAAWALDVQGNWKSALISHALGARTRVAPAYADLRERSSRLVPARRASAARGPHVLDRGLAVIESALGRAVDRAELPSPPFLSMSEPDCEARWARDGVPIGPETVVVVLQHVEDPRAIPLSLVDSLARERDVVCLAGPREARLNWPGTWTVVRQASGDLGDLVAFGCSVARRGARIVGPDCGATHVLRACGAPTLFAFGPQDPARTGPLDGRVVTRGSEPPLACQPCVAKRCRLPEGPLCMTEIETTAVLAALDAMDGSRR